MSIGSAVSAGPSDGDDRCKRDRGDTGPDQGRAPAACQPGGEHDRYRLDPLHGGGEENGDEQEGIATHSVRLHNTSFRLGVEAIGAVARLWSEPHRSARDSIRDRVRHGQ